MRSFTLMLLLCLPISGCEKGSRADFSEIQFPTGRNGYTYHGPRGSDSVIRINKENDLRLETSGGDFYVNPTHDDAVEILRSVHHLDKYPRVHIFLDRRATAAPIRKAYAMIQDGEIEGYLFAVNLEDNPPPEKYFGLFALLFEVPSPEIRAQRFEGFEAR